MLGAAGTFAAWVSVVILHDEARTVGLAWMAIGVVGFVVYRRIQRLDLTTPTRIPRPQRPVGFKELDYRSALVPIFGTDVDGRGMASAVGLVGEDAYVDAVYVIRVPTQLSLDAGLEREEAVALNVLETARLRAQRAGLKVHTRIIRTRNPGAALVEEARRQHSEVVYLATAHAPPDEQALGPTASYLLAKRPCRVIVETGPARAGTREAPNAAGIQRARQLSYS